MIANMGNNLLYFDEEILEKAGLRNGRKAIS